MDDYQLNLLENYILKNRHLKEMRNKIRQDFNFLTQKIKNYNNNNNI